MFSFGPVDMPIGVYVPCFVIFVGTDMAGNIGLLFSNRLSGATPTTLKVEPPGFVLIKPKDWSSLTISSCCLSSSVIPLSNPFGIGITLFSHRKHPPQLHFLKAAPILLSLVRNCTPVCC